MIDVYQASYDGGQQRVIDVIKEHPSSCGERAWAMVEPAKQLLEAARVIGLPIIYSLAMREVTPKRAALQIE